MSARARLSISCKPSIALCGICFCALFFFGSAAAAKSAYVRVNQIGYEEDNPPFRAYLMSTVPEPGAIFSVINSQGVISYSGPIGALLGTWGHSANLTYDVYALDFTVPGGDIYTISVSGPVPAQSPRFAVDSPGVLYPGLLLNTLFFMKRTVMDQTLFPMRCAPRPATLKTKTPASTLLLLSTLTTSSITCPPLRLSGIRSSRTLMPWAVGGTPATT